MSLINLNWADEIESEFLDAEEKPLPLPSEVYKNDLKIVTKYHLNEEGKLVKTMTTSRIEKQLVSKSMALRKTWAKFGDAADDGPGPNAANTINAEKVEMQFISEAEEMEEDSSLNNLKNLGSVVKCRKCAGDHWTSKCPVKDTSLGNENPRDDSSEPASKYVPPTLRRGSESSVDPSEELTQIRILNLSEFTTEEDLRDLARPFGAVERTFLARDREHNLCKGFGFITFRCHADAAAALKALNRHKYDYLILRVEWAKPKER